MLQAADLIFGPVAAQHDYQHAIFFRLFAGFLELVALQNWVLKVITSPACTARCIAVTVMLKWAAIPLVIC